MHISSCLGICAHLSTHDKDVAAYRMMTKVASGMHRLVLFFDEEKRTMANFLCHAQKSYQVVPMWFLDDILGFSRFVILAQGPCEVMLSRSA